MVLSFFPSLNVSEWRIVQKFQKCRQRRKRSIFGYIVGYGDTDWADTGQVIEALVNEEIDLEIALRERLKNVVESRLNLALLLHEAATKQPNPVKDEGNGLCSRDCRVVLTHPKAAQTTLRRRHLQLMLLRTIHWRYFSWMNILTHRGYWNLTNSNCCRSLA